jgi:hypothetical protein
LQGELWIPSALSRAAELIAGAVRHGRGLSIAVPAGQALPALAGLLR